MHAADTLWRPFLPFAFPYVLPECPLMVKLGASERNHLWIRLEFLRSIPDQVQIISIKPTFISPGRLGQPPPGLMAADQLPPSFSPAQYPLGETHTHSLG